MNRLLALVLVATLVPGVCIAQTSGVLRLDTLLRDHLVVQREQPVPVRGWTAPGETVTASLDGHSATAIAGSDGGWTVTLPALPAGGPFALDVSTSGGERLSVADVLVGDVFLCSGQSNMELQVSRSLNAPTEIAQARNDRIRLLKVDLATSITPLDTLGAVTSWAPASPGVIADWSAACYYFARELQPKIEVPIGLINSSWGGSDIRAWMPAEALASVGGYEGALKQLREYATDPALAQQSFGKEWEAWWRARTGDAPGEEPWQPGVGASWNQAPEALGDWKEWGVDDMKAHLGMLWFRTTLNLTEDQAATDVDLLLGGIDEVDETWINGQVLGNTFGWGTERTYHVPAALLRPGENVVVTNVLNTWGAGGLTGPLDARALVLAAGERVPLRDWQYLKVPAELGGPPRTPWESVGGRTTIYNAMIAPLHDLPLKGVLWYQGETNAGEAEAYQNLLTAFMKGWREQFGSELPFLIVQLANYGTVPTAPVESGWARLRESQRRAVLADPQAALVVAIDIGTPYDIHPPNKQELGRRLARAARHLVYGETAPATGPIPVALVREEGAAVLSFSGVEGGLVARGDDRPVGFEVCGDAAGSCRYANAEVDGLQVRLDAGPDVTRVRYCWADSPVCTLYDRAGLPAGPFELTLP